MEHELSDVLAVTSGPKAGLYINGMLIPGVITVDPEVGKGAPVIRITLACERFTVEREAD